MVYYTIIFLEQELISLRKHVVYMHKSLYDT